MSVSPNLNSSLKFGCSAGIFCSLYTPGDKTGIDYSPQNMEGFGWSGGAIAGVGVNVSNPIISPEEERAGKYHHWRTISILMGPSIGGSIGLSYTFVPFVWGK